MKTITFDETKWKLVPVEPTREMLMAALDTDNASYDNHQYVLTKQWKDMLAAAPSQLMGDEEKQTLVYEKLLACLQCGATSQESAVPQGLSAFDELGDEVIECVCEPSQPVTLTDELDLLDVKVSAGLCQMTADGKHAYLREIQVITAAMREKEAKATP